MYCKVNKTAPVTLQIALLGLFSTKKLTHPRVRPGLKYFHTHPTSREELEMPIYKSMTAYFTCRLLYFLEVS